ncbi:MAG: hypothetical protein ACW99A_08590 [Candidatus Kariarchaeaceae archaeon]|jgi:hypothetical protein
MANQTDENSSTIMAAKENRSTAKIEGEPSFATLKKALLVFFAIMIAGPLELLIILWFENR